MATIITQEQLQQIQQKVERLAADRADAEAKTQASAQAAAQAAQASTASAHAQLDESAADGKVSADLTDLTAFLNSLSAPEPAPVAHADDDELPGPAA